MRDRVIYAAAVVLLVVFGIGVGVFATWTVGRLNAVENMASGMATDLNQKVFPGIQKELEALKAAQDAPAKK